MILVLSHCLKFVKGLESSGTPISCSAMRRWWWWMRMKLCANRSCWEQPLFLFSPSLQTICNCLWQSSINSKCCVPTFRLIKVVKTFFKKKKSWLGWGFFVCLLIWFLSCILPSWAGLTWTDRSTTKLFSFFGFSSLMRMFWSFLKGMLWEETFILMYVCTGRKPFNFFPLSLFKQMGWFFAHFEVGVGL